jgi:hypothetical protein
VATLGVLAGRGFLCAGRGYVSVGRFERLADAFESVVRGWRRSASSACTEAISSLATSSLRRRALSNHDW